MAGRRSARWGSGAERFRSARPLNDQTWKSEIRDLGLLLLQLVSTLMQRGAKLVLLNGRSILQSRHQAGPSSWRAFLANARCAPCSLDGFCLPSCTNVQQGSLCCSPSTGSLRGEWLRGNLSTGLINRWNVFAAPWS